MRFIFISYNYSPDADSPTKWIKKIGFYAGTLEYLARSNEVFRIERINHEGELLHNGVYYYFKDYGKKKIYFSFSLHRFVKKLRPDVVVIASFYYPLQTILLRLKLGRKVKIIVQHHAEKPFIGPKKILQRFANRFVDACMFTSFGNAEEWIRKKIIPSPVKCHEILEVSTDFRRQNKDECKSRLKMAGDNNFLWVGNLISRKDPVTILIAFSEYLDRNQAAKLYMIYRKGELLEKIKKLIETMPALQTSVFLIGNVSHEELENWYTAADFFILGSHAEGSGTALIEAMACGCIPVITDIPSFRKITDDGRLAFLSAPGNADAFFDSLKKTETINKEEFSKDLINYFEKELSFQAIAKKINELCRQLQAE